MNMSAGAPCSICLINVLLAAYEMTTFLPLSRAALCCNLVERVLQADRGKYQRFLDLCECGVRAAPRPAPAQLRTASLLNAVCSCSSMFASCK